MKVYQMKCPACGSKIDVKEDQKTFFCSYCGSKLFFDDGVQRIEVHNTEHKIYTDEAKIKENDRKEKELFYRDKQDKRNNWMAFGLIGLLLFISLVFTGIGLWYEREEAPGEGEIAIPMSAKAYHGENYKEVVHELEAMGFENIETVPKEDLVTGWITKEGEVARISIAGDSKFEEGEIFSKEADVIVTYHTFKK